ncbi:carbon dioxide-concentrating mechanism protein CcmK [Lusitaniella coriacea LEGE 07157]|uniref:Carboxysome shell protein CcmK n=1 Tax=Lusitaniella coriacea LEGE 07157 TaxID=945747 RepID=A0A8J7DXC0_9CYAN|nr:carbon dioxide-concentrating mechanism protein CcmK [Lusitaniella coriacea]MBE9117067.1 carbon dioxide-concentrating mechanism protein CcmK [Lusitaniella coriacea LEGE 07157]
MPDAVGVVETLGFPSILATADAMVKAAAVTVVYCDKAESGRFLVAIRGHVAEVKRAQEAGIEAAENVYGGEVITHYIVPNPPQNVVSVLPLEYTEQADPFR